ncbi:pLS20_p028 family conjugation system transmembrane protein [Bacillus rugosus]|uniref:pLS20_p028 family conjugation system transmembrane protein n=1 Tax=Bacillus rugosus TaxID=2715209 RepID=UPI003D203501
MDDKEILKKLQEFGDMLNIATIPGDALRAVGWLIIKMMVLLVNSLDGLLTKIITLNGFFEDDDVIKFMTEFRPVLWVAMSIAVAILGYLFITNKVKDRSSVLTNTLLAISFVILLPTMMSQLSDLAQAGNEAVKGGSKSKTGSQIVQMNMADLKLYNENDFDKIGKEKIKPSEYENNVSKNDIMNISINETVDKDGVLAKKLVQGTDGEVKVEGLDSGSFWLSIGEEFYYRWSWHFWTILITLGITAFSMIVSLIKVSRIIFELPFKQLFGSFVAVTDLQGGQRTKQMFISVFSSFAILIVIAVIMKFYMLYTAWVASLNLGIAGLFLLIGGSLAMLDGPQEVVKILGMDAGLKDGQKDMMATYAFLKGGGAITRSLGNFGGKVASGVASTVGSGAGLVRGIKNGLNGGGNGEGSSLYSAMGGAAGGALASSALGSMNPSVNGDQESKDKTKNNQDKQKSLYDAMNANGKGSISPNLQKDQLDKQLKGAEKGKSPDALNSLNNKGLSSMQNKGNNIYSQKGTENTPNALKEATNDVGDLKDMKNNNSALQAEQQLYGDSSHSDQNEQSGDSVNTTNSIDTNDSINSSGDSERLPVNNVNDSEQPLEKMSQHEVDQDNDVKGIYSDNVSETDQTKNVESAASGAGLTNGSAVNSASGGAGLTNGSAVNSASGGAGLTNGSAVNSASGGASLTNGSAVNSASGGASLMNGSAISHSVPEHSNISSQSVTPTNVTNHQISSPNVVIEEERDGRGNVFKPGYLRPETQYTTFGQNKYVKEVNDSFVKGHNQTHGLGMKLGSAVNKIKNNSINKRKE